MTVTPSCPALLIHDDDAFRQSLIAQLDQKHFSVTYTDSSAEGIQAAGAKTFKVIIVAVDLKRRVGLDVLDYLKQRRAQLNGTAILIIGESDPELRSYAMVADETLLKPVDSNYVAERARIYCRH
jgi:DNA-binding response OmpR family regulator